jgi:hypothetical protein
LLIKFINDAELSVKVARNGTHTKSGAEDINMAGGTIVAQCCGRMKWRSLSIVGRARNIRRFCRC